MDRYTNSLLHIKDSHSTNQAGGLVCGKAVGARSCQQTAGALDLRWLINPMLIHRPIYGERHSYSRSFTKSLKNIVIVRSVDRTNMVLKNVYHQNLKIITLHIYRSVGDFSYNYKLFLTISNFLHLFVLTPK
jgi:hypothetical protein